MPIALAVALAGVLVAVECSPLTPEPRPPSLGDWTVEGQLELRREIPGLTLQFYDGEALWGTRGADVFVSPDLGRSWTRSGRLCPREPGPVAALRHTLGASHVARLFRPPGGIESLLVLRSGTVLASAGDRVYRQAAGEADFHVVHRQRAEPEWKKIFRQWGEDASGAVWFGEYGVARAADSRVFVGREDGTRWEVAHTFPRSGQIGGVRHIHGVQVDPYTGRVWVVTGDRPGESRIGWLGGEGGFTTAGKGSRQWTAVSLMFTPRSVQWGTDALREPCGVFRWDRISGVTEQVAELGGPVFHSTALADGRLVLATEVEGIGTDGVELWIGSDTAPWKRVAVVPPFEDPDRRRLGTLSFPLGEPLPALMFTADRVGKTERAAFVGALPGE